MTRPISGVGVGLRGPHADELIESDRPLDFLEIIPENYVGRGGRDRARLLACRERWPILVHGVSLSIGGPDPFDLDYLSGLRSLLDALEVPFYTDHLCFTSWGGFQSHQLLPLPMSDEAVRHAAARIDELRHRLDRPVAVENITQYAVMPGSTMSTSQFVAAVCDEADCGLLLDVNNLFLNARNLDHEVAAAVDTMPLDRVVQIHIAGHEIRKGRYIDNHGAPVSIEVQDLLRKVLGRVPAGTPVLLERDLNLPPLETLLDEADQLRALVASSRGDR